MLKQMLPLFAVAVLIAPGCAHQKKSRAGEPLDPMGDELASKKSDDTLPRLLTETVLHFGFDDATLSAADQKSLQRLAEAMRVRPWAAIRIAGHCDERGTEEYNLALGQRRADASRAYLVALGVPDDSVETITFGEEAPVVAEDNEAAWAANRRAEFGPVPLELFGYLDTEAK